MSITARRKVTQQFCCIPKHQRRASAATVLGGHMPPKRPNPQQELKILLEGARWNSRNPLCGRTLDSERRRMFNNFMASCNRSSHLLDKVK